MFLPTWTVLLGELVSYFVMFSSARSLAAGTEGKEEDELSEVRASHAKPLQSGDALFLEARRRFGGTRRHRSPAS